MQCSFEFVKLIHLRFLYEPVYHEDSASSHEFMFDRYRQPLHRPERLDIICYYFDHLFTLTEGSGLTFTYG